ncbi:MAG: hypothetical protein ABI947_23025 [Chloroflexota bacterium]
MSKAIIVPDLAYTSRAGRRGGRSNGYKELLAKTKYLQYRNDADGHIPQQAGMERWVDCGMGHNYREIAQSADRLGSDKVLAWTWVVSPAPDLMALVPETEREGLLKGITEEIVEAYYEARGMDTPEFSYVLHDRLTKPDATTGERWHQFHTHVILPGTVPQLDGPRVPFYNRSSHGHVKLLKNISDEKFAHALDSAIGPHWRDLRPEEPKVAPALDMVMEETPPPAPAEGLSELDRWFPRRPELEML